MSLTLKVSEDAPDEHVTEVRMDLEPFVPRELLPLVNPQTISLELPKIKS